MNSDYLLLLLLAQSTGKKRLAEVLALVSTMKHIPQQEIAKK